MKFDKIRYTYLRSTNGHPHTCIAIKVDVTGDQAMILYSVARRESPGATIFLKRRMQKIRELGGVVPESLHRQLQLLRKDFSKKKARFVAWNRLSDEYAYIAAEGVPLKDLNAHSIMQTVMTAIKNHAPKVQFMNVGGVDLPTTVPGIMECAREGADDWLREHTQAVVPMLFGGKATAQRETQVGEATT